ncbi:hypothetical protein ABZ567_01825 [Streptomyces sp. NPDC016459]
MARPPPRAVQAPWDDQVYQWLPERGRYVPSAQARPARSLASPTPG